MAHINQQTSQHQHAEHQKEPSEQARRLMILSSTGLGDNWEYEIVIRAPTPIPSTDYLDASPKALNAYCHSNPQEEALTSHREREDDDNDDDDDDDESDADDFFDADSHSGGDGPLDVDDSLGSEAFFDALETLQEEHSQVRGSFKSEEDSWQESLDEAVCEWQEMLRLMELGDVYTYYK